MTGARLGLFLAKRQLRHRRLRTLTIALTVALATCCVATIVILDANTVRTRQWQQIAQNGDPDLTLRIAGSSRESAERFAREVRADPDVEAVLLLLRWAPPTYRDGVPVWLIEGDRKSFRCVVPDRGEAAGADILVGPGVKDPGGTFKLGDRELRPNGRAGTLFLAARAASNSYILLDPADDHGRDLTFEPTVWVRSTRPEAVSSRFQDRALVRDAPDRSVWRTAEDVAMRAAIRVASLLAFLLSGFALAHVTAMGLLDRARELAVLRALGLLRRRLVRMGLIEVLLVSLPASVGGLAIAFGLAAVLGRLGVSTLGRMWVPFWFDAIPYVELVVVMAAANLTPVIGAWLPLRIVHRLDVPTALGPVFNSRPPASPPRRGANILVGALVGVTAVALTLLLARVESPRVAVVLQRALALVAAGGFLILFLPRVASLGASVLQGFFGRWFGPLGRLGSGVGRETQKGFVPPLVGIVAVFSVVLVLKNLVGSMEDEIRVWGQRALEGRAVATYKTPLSDQEYRLLMGRSVKARPLPVVAEWSRPFPIRALRIPDGLDFSSQPPEEAQTISDLLCEDTVVCSTALAIREKIAVGDRLNLPTTTGVRGLRVVAVTDVIGSLATDRGFAIVSEDTGRRHLGLGAAPPIRRVLLRSLEGDDIDPGFESILDAPGLPEASLLLGSEKLAWRLAKTRRDFLVFDVVWGFLILLAAVGTAGTIFLRALERRRELALLRILGATRTDFRSYFVVQGLALGLVGGGLALLLSVPLTGGAVWALRHVSGMGISFTWSLPWALLCWALALLLGVAAGLAAARRSRRIMWANAIKYE